VIYHLFRIVLVETPLYRNDSMLFRPFFSDCMLSVTSCKCPATP